ncbi:hypothetical protein QFC21_001275 [Naganishia friedmannii]|uniref:Uncharacterized protein n=1 Tax=Naganishia friedmannii TaxID=89922 RepID=A0ACC2W348_9TREE|nr:hypothetical protein QFC21_001275 [Naganishia friedmannii]
MVLPIPAASTSLTGPSRRPEGPPRELLLANIALQTDLTNQLCSSLAHAALPSYNSRTPRPPSRSQPDYDAILSIYENLVDATDEQAQLLEYARKYQERKRRLQWKRKQALERENAVRGVLMELERGRAELEELVKDGEQVVSRIQLAEKAKFSVDELLAYAQNLASTTSRPPSLHPPAPLLAAEMLYPVESIMQSGKLAALARGEVIGILGDTQVIGTAKDQPGPEIVQPATETMDPPAKHPPTQTAGLSEPANPSSATSGTVQPVHAPFKLDLSDSEDDD